MDTIRPTLRERLITASVLLPLLAVTALMRLVNLVGAPQRVDDEGTYVAQAYAMLHLGSITHYTYWYDHPPLGWLQIAGWLGLSEWFGPVDDGVAAGRRFMVVLAVVTAALLWVLVRRLGYGRVAAGGAVAIMALSPLAVQYQRTVYLDNIATLWVLAAAVCLCTPRRRLAAYMGAGACFALAVLSKETALLLLPAVIWLGWQRGNPGTRRYAMAVAGTVFGLLVFAYVLAAAVRSELIPGPGHVSLIDGVTFQLFSRTSGGSVFAAGSPNQATVSGWIQLDGVLLGAGVVAGVIAMGVKDLRPLAFGHLLLVAMLLRGGYLPIPYVIAVIPLSALLVATVAAEAGRRLRTGNNGVRAVAAAVLVAVAAAGVIAQPRWRDTIDFLTTVDRDAPARDAEQWVLDNVPRTDRIVVDDVFWADLVAAGWNRNDVGWFYKLDTDPAVQALNPHGWKDYDYIIATSAVRQFPATFPQIHGALTGSVPVASFGVGTERVEVRRIDPTASGTTPPPAAAEPERVTVGAALAQRLGPDAAPATADLLRAGRVDARVLATLSDFATVQPVKVADLPAEPGEDAAGRPRREVLLTAPGEQATRIVTWFRAQRGAFAVQDVASGPDGVLVTFPPAAPSGLLAVAAKPPAPGKPAALRVLDLVPGSGPQRVRLAGLDGTAVAPIAAGPYGDIGHYFAVPAGVSTLSIGAADPAAPTALSQAVALAPGGTYTLMLFAAAGGGVAGQLVPDPVVAGPGIRGVVRLAHADDRAQNLTVDVAGVGPLAKNISYGLVTGYAELVPGNVAITLTSGTVKTTATVPLRARDVRTLVVLDGPGGPRLTVVPDPTRAPAAAPLPVTPAARRGVLAPPPPSSAAADAAPITAPLAASGKPLGEVPLAVLAFGLLAGLVGFLLRRRRGAAADGMTAPEIPSDASDVTVVVRRVQAVLGRAPRPQRAPDDPDRTALVEDIEALRERAAAMAGSAAAAPAMPAGPLTGRPGPARLRERPLGAVPAGWCPPAPPAPQHVPAATTGPVAFRPAGRQIVGQGTGASTTQEVIRSARPARLGAEASAPGWVPAGSPSEGPTVTLVRGLDEATARLPDQRACGLDATEFIGDLGAIRREVERRRNSGGGASFI